MAAAELLAGLLEATLASSVALLLVLALRLPLQRGFGAGVAYALWLLVPVALISVALPPAATSVQWGGAVAITVLSAMPVGSERVENGIDIASWCLAGWGVGVLLSLGWAGAQQLNFLRALGPLQRRDDGVLQARSVAGLPAVIGWWAPAIVVPADFDARYSPQQCELMQAHERSHIRRGDLHWNAVAMLLRALFWFNPLLHFAARRFHDDQELACDARVIARHPHARRAYGEAMLKTQLAAQPLPLGCHWGQTHPLKERIAMLARPVPTLSRWLAGSCLTLALLAGGGFSVWAMQPAQPTEARGVLSTKVTIIGGLNSPRDAVGQVAQQLGLEVANPEVLSGKKFITYNLSNMPASAVLKALAGEEGFQTNVSGNQLELAVAATTTGGRPAHGSDHALHAPVYPADAAEQGISGRVILLVNIDAQGIPTDIQVDAADPKGVFEAAAREAAKQWRFTPEMQDGKPVSTRVRVPIDFEAPKLPITPATS